MPISNVVKHERKELVAFAQQLHAAFHQSNDTQVDDWSRVCSLLKQHIPTTLDLIIRRYQGTRSTKFLTHFILQSTMESGKNFGFFPTGELAEILTENIKKRQTLTMSTLEYTLYDSKKTYSSKLKREILHPAHEEFKNKEVWIAHQSRQEEFSTETLVYTNESLIHNYLNHPTYPTASKAHIDNEIEELIKEVNSSSLRIENLVLETMPFPPSRLWTTERSTFAPNNTLVVYFCDVIPSERAASTNNYFLKRSAGLSLHFIWEVISNFPNARLHLALDSAYSFLYLWLTHTFANRQFTTEVYDLSLEVPFFDDVFCYWHPLNQKDPQRYAVNIISEATMLGLGKDQVVSKRFGTEWNDRISRAGGDPRRFHTHFYTGNREASTETTQISNASNHITQKQKFRFILAASLSPEWNRDDSVNINGILEFLFYIHDYTDHPLLVINAAHHSEREDPVFAGIMAHFRTRGTKTEYCRRLDRKSLLARLSTTDIQFTASPYKPAYIAFTAPLRVTSLLELGIPSIISKGQFSRDFELMLAKYSAGLVIDEFRHEPMITYSRAKSEYFAETIQNIEIIFSRLELFKKGAVAMSTFLKDHNRRLMRTLF